MDSTTDLFAQYLAKENINFSLESLFINMLIGLAMSLILEFTYVRCSRSISNRRMFAKNFPLLILTTLLIIMVVKSSLALSLGLVGALSIVRFRTAIKEPEELAFLFISISIGLGLGANQLAITISGFVSLIIVVWGRYFLTKKETFSNLYMNVSTNNIKQFSVEKISSIISKESTSVDLRRYDLNDTSVEVSFLVELKNPNSLDRLKEELSKFDSKIKISFLDNKQIL